jgi:hypothetical protein
LNDISLDPVFGSFPQIWDRLQIEIQKLSPELGRQPRKERGERAIEEAVPPVCLLKIQSEPKFESLQRSNIFG